MSECFITEGNPTADQKCELACLTAEGGEIWFLHLFHLSRAVRTSACNSSALLFSLHEQLRHSAAFTILSDLQVARQDDHRAKGHHAAARLPLRRLQRYLLGLSPFPFLPSSLSLSLTHTLSLTLSLMEKYIRCNGFPFEI